MTFATTASATIWKTTGLEAEAKEVEAKSRSEISRIEEAVQALVHGTKNAAKEI